MSLGQSRDSARENPGAMRGLGVMEVAAIAGHKGRRMLKRYTHPRTDDLVRKLSAA